MVLEILRDVMMNERELFNLLINSLSNRTGYIPYTRFVYLNIGERRDRQALLYRIPNNKFGSPYIKGVNISEFYSAFIQFTDHGDLTARWFRNNLQQSFNEGGCNFKFLGGCFKIAGILERYERGRFY